ncbi:MAG: hypothetical protein AVDCRST_MAG28-549 [uncultured Rubrobacteraceae bacterium]|uniref:Uncharacterized protein n=1 Tax=uncultured Rubrobacteraceae bacterium TaxID=349277 RepID=A0A6J4QFA4_9ACTN|nr:MAG: hypothetical protein AVDCRST_MAG28-549 [uncultured Rubrobacteraceae bacterium]
MEQGWESWEQERDCWVVLRESSALAGVGFASLEQEMGWGLE